GCDIAADPRSIRSSGVFLPSRGPGGRWISCANSENRSGLACWAVLGPKVSIQTSHACREDRPPCPTCRHLTSMASAVAGHVCPTRLQRLWPGSIEGRSERPNGTVLLALLVSSFPLGPCRSLPICAVGWPAYLLDTSFLAVRSPATSNRPTTEALGPAE